MDMTGLTLLLFMVAIGAIIGGITNHLAIKMLFKPHNAKYLFGKKIPFTPGLIPKRREELADQMGKMVVGHLLTPDGIRKKLSNHEFHQTLKAWLKKEATGLMNSEKTVIQIAESFGITHLDEKIESKLSAVIDREMNAKVDKYLSLTIKEALPEQLLLKVEKSMPLVSEYIAQKGIDYVESEEGKQRLSKMIDDFLAERGMLGGMVQMFLGNTSLIDKVQPEVIKFLRNAETKRLITSLIENEWKRIEELKVEEIEEKVQLNKLLFLTKQMILRQIAIKDRLNVSISVYMKPYEEWVENDGIPKLIGMSLSYFEKHMDEILEQLHLQEIVREQVQSFSVSRLEEMVLGISKREFTMITYLGALLGGIIGGIQAVVIMMIG